MDTEKMIEALLNPAAYPEQTSRVRLVQTHISWVFICDEFVYKLKKPMNFGFLDFSAVVVLGRSYPGTSTPESDSATALLALGLHHPGLPLGALGTSYLLPIYAVYALPPSPKQKQTYRILDLSLPAGPVLIGATLSWQAWLPVATVPGGVIHSAGLDMFIGG